MDLDEALEAFLGRTEESRKAVLSEVLGELEMWSWDDFADDPDGNNEEDSETLDSLIVLLTALKDS
jgi:hypothetical protein